LIAQEGFVMIRRFFRREQQPGAGNVAQGRDFKPGDLVEQRYEVEHIRAGFMGIVYIAYDLKRRSRVVLKTFQNKFLWNDAAIQRFNIEADLWMRLGTHPNIVRAYDLRDFMGKPHVVAEYVHGGPMRGLVGLMPPEEALGYCIQICWGMTHAVEQGNLMHCDLKPDNIMVTLDGRAKVTDFGLARVLPIWQWSDAQRLNRQPQVRAPSTETFSGTLPYMAPELFSMAEPAGMGVDIYAFGVMLYELLTGRLPFDAPNDNDVIRMHLSQEPPDPRRRKPELPEEADLLVRRCMAKSPSERPQSFREIERALHSLYGAVTGHRFAMQRPEARESDGEAWMDRGQMHMELREYNDALSCFRHAVTLSGEQPKSWIMLGRARLKLWHYNEALRAVDDGLRRAVSHNDYSQLYQLRGEVLTAMQRPTEALAAFDQGLSYTPKAPGLWREKAALYLRQGLTREAIGTLEKARGLDPLDPAVWMLMGDAYVADQQPRKAQRAYAESLRLAPRSATGWMRYGQVQLKLGLGRDAVRSFEAALKLEPDLDEAKTGLHFARYAAK
jgi:tetratricopeptide (TPR) repeat protein